MVLLGHKPNSSIKVMSGIRVLNIPVVGGPYSVFDQSNKRRY